ncbi:MAG: hypothetical protein AAFP20_10255 [Cyanobacteria bacterium J06614_10]
MVKSEADGWVPLEGITDHPLADVQVCRGGRCSLWDNLGQAFRYRTC